MRFRVVLVPFPFDDLSGQKVRPAVCLTNPVGTHRHVVLAFITSTVPPLPEPTDILLTPGTPDFTATGPPDYASAPRCVSTAWSRCPQRLFNGRWARSLRVSRH